MSALSAELLIPSSSFVFINGYSQNSLLVRTRAIVALISFTIIFLVALNSFRNMWLSLPSYNRLLERPEELTYKRLLFVYLCLMGCLIFFCNTVKLGVVYCSAVAMLLHIVFMVSLVRIHPYRQSLRVHTVSLLFNNAVLLVFLFVVNLINYVDGLDSLVILVLGYFVTVCCFFQILLTFVRLYYELRYGRELEIKIQDEREYQRQQEELERLMKMKENELRMKQQAKLKQSDEQKMREMNQYLFETQINEDRKEDLWRWLETREWEQKLKDAEYFKNYSEKPLKWMKDNDQGKFQ
jgi:signal transduction histidine kinase